MLRRRTIKEAFSKAAGRGLGISPSAICRAGDGMAESGRLVLVPPLSAGSYRGAVDQAGGDARRPGAVPPSPAGHEAVLPYAPSGRGAVPRGLVTAQSKSRGPAEREFLRGPSPGH